ncbi:MAG: hypothetical protein HPY75_11975 [Actinobacteria bacterium]|nr:hypothetical protein [Actinomycetota bacterium]
MARIMVSVYYQPTGESKDFEIPDRMCASDFGQKIAEAFEGKILSDPNRFWFQVQSVSLAKFLRADETLKASGVWDGDTLIVSKHLKEGTLISPAPVLQAGPVAAGPGPQAPGQAAGWSELNIDVHKEERKSGVGRTFIWKKMG